MKKVRGIIKKIYFILLVFLILSHPFYGQENEKKSFAIKTDKPLIIDGHLNEPIWNKAPDVNDLLFAHKDRIKGDIIQTSVKALYNQKYLYLAFTCIDNQPEMIYGEVTARDSDLRFDDSVWVLLDVYDNLDEYYYFGINVLGTTVDGIFKKDGSLLDPEWNGEWEVKVQRFDKGWTAEAAIDLNFLMYRPTEGDTLGISLSRVVPRLESTYVTELLDPAFKLTDIVSLKRIGFTFPERNFKLTPYLLPNSALNGGTDISAGLDAQVNINKNTKFSLTVNPDFFTTEPDQEVFNLTHYELFIPEKRYFFSDLSSIHQMPHIQLYYSKRIPEVIGGIETQGSFPGLEFAASSVQTKKIEEFGGNSANFSMLRVNKKVFSSSSFGILAANRTLNGQNTGAVGIDSYLSLSPNLSLTGQFALSYGDYKTDNIAFSLVPSYNSKTSHFHIGYFYIGSYFGDNVNEVGFIWDDNRHEVDLGLNKAFILDKFGIEWIKYISKYNIYWGSDNILRSWEVEQGISILKQNRFKINLFHYEAYKLFDKGYRNHYNKIFFGFDTREWTLFNTILTIGEYFDNKFQLYEINKQLTIGRSLSVVYAFQVFLAKLEERKKQYQIHMLKFRYDIHKNLWINGFFQINKEIDKINLQLFFSYRFKPPIGTIQCGFQKGDPRFGFVEREKNTLILKIFYGF